VPVRREGKLPRQTRSAEYTLEYRSDTLHVHADAIRPGQRVLIVDDVLATGGTAAAAVELMGELEAEVVGLGFLLVRYRRMPQKRQAHTRERGA
jgi:adenine phosphoribosyltransferase